MARRQKTDYEIVPIQRLDVYQTVLERIRTLIRDAHLQTGDQLPSERELAEKLGVSRVSVRQAIKVLVSMGILEARVGSGTFLRNQSDQVVVDHLLADQKLDVKFLNELVELRTAIEVRVFLAASERWRRADTERIRALLSRSGSELSESSEEEGSLDLRFEAMVGEASGNLLLQRFQRIVHEMWVRGWAGAGLMPDRREKLHQEHLAMFEAMKVADWDRALALIEAHVSRKVELPDS